MTQEFVPYELALKLKVLGFDEPCLGFYSINNQHFKDGYFHISTENPFSTDIEPIQQELRCISAPLYQQAFRWFREKYNINGYQFIYQTMDGGYALSSVEEHDQVDGYFEAYEEAEQACLNKLIEIVKGGEQ